MYKPPLLLALALAACASLPAFAGEPITECTELGAGYQATRFGSQYLFVKDGQSHYRVGFNMGHCDAMTVTNKLEIVTEGQTNRLCPSGSRVKTKRQSCAINEVRTVDESEYQRFTRRSK